MGNMKNLFYLICAASIISVSSCGILDGNNTSEGSKEVTTIVELPDTVKQKIVEQDSLMKELVFKIDEITSELNTSKEEIAELKKRIETFESPKNKWAYITIVAFFLAILSLVIAFYKSREKRINGIITNYLDHSDRINGLLTNVNSLLLQRNSGTTPKVSTRDIENDIKLLKMQIKKVEADINVINYAIKKQNEMPVHSESPKQNHESQYHKVGYAKVDTDIYFTTIYDSNQEGCVFKISFTSLTQGKFNIISLDKIQSRNDWQKKVECSGISIKDASDFRLEDEGLCEKIDENTWKVTKPLKIRLLK